MQCLGVPVDFRLRNFIREWRRPLSSDSTSNHVKTLYDFGKQVKGENAELTSDQVSFALDLAKPRTQRGVVIAVLQPTTDQTYHDSYGTNIENCETLDAIRDVLSLFGLRCDDVSIFNAFPFIADPDLDNTNHTHEASHHAFQQMVMQKRPEVVVSCFETPFRVPLSGSLKSLGIGESWPMKRFKFKKKIFLTRVNAFNPRYALKQNPTESCFRQLLVLQLAAGFGTWVNTWTEEPWMEKLRDDCRSCAEMLAQDVRDTSDSAVLNEKFSMILAKFQQALENSDEGNNYFTSYGLEPDDSDSDSKTIEARDDIVAKGITKICCDAYLVLNEIRQGTLELQKSVAQESIRFFRTFGAGLWPSKSQIPPRNKDITEAGYYDQDVLMLKESNLNGRFARYMDESLLTFIRDLNLTIKLKLNNVYSVDLSDQGDAFLRFAHAIEDGLETTLVNEPVDSDSDVLISKLDAMSV